MAIPDNIIFLILNAVACLTEMLLLQANQFFPVLKNTEMQFSGTVVGKALQETVG